MKKEEKATLEQLADIMKKLRSPEGCPWDREQTKESLKPFLIEEAYEVLEALEEGNSEKLKEELGDLLFQIMFYTQVTEELGEFNVYDVIQTVKEKMIRRHPHVFGQAKAETSAEVLINWEHIKRGEKDISSRRSVLDGVPKKLPALLRAHRVQDKVSRVGFDWEHIDQVFAKVKEEMGEFQEALACGDHKNIEEELGDLLFALVNIARFIQINPEEALRKTVVKFTNRFHFIEESLIAEGKDIKTVSLEEMDQLWEKAKKV